MAGSDRVTPVEPRKPFRPRLNTERTAVAPPGAGNRQPPRPIPRVDLDETQESPPPWPKGKRHDSPPPTLEAVQSAREGFELVVEDAERRAQQAEAEAQRLRNELRAERRKSSPRVESEPPPSKDQQALAVGRAAIWLWKKLGWGGSLGGLSVLIALFGSDRLQTAWARLSTLDAQDSQQERRVGTVETRLGELAEYTVCVEEQTAEPLSALTPPKEQMAVSAPKLKPYERKCKRPEWLPKR